MQYSSVFLAAVLALACSSTRSAEDETFDPTPRHPQLTAFLVSPTRANQCRPIRFRFVLTNNTSQTMVSQRPYSGSTYTLYRRFDDRGLRTLPKRYMIGISLDGGRDEYPYRWGFRGRLHPGHSITIVGYLVIPELGTHIFTPALIYGGRVVSKSEFEPASVQVEQPELSGLERVVPEPGEPICSVINGRVIEASVVPYMHRGHVLVPARPFVYNLGGEIYWFPNSIVIRKPGVDLVLFAGTQRGLLNGVPIFLPAPTHVHGGVAYLPPRFVSPFLGATVYWEPFSRILYIRGPEPW